VVGPERAEQLYAHVSIRLLMCRKKRGHMDEHKRTCSFCGKVVDKKDSISHFDQDGISCTVCRLCIATGAKIFGMRNLKEDAGENNNGCPGAKDLKILTPKQIFTELEKHVIGQSALNKELAVFAFHHLSRAKRFLDGEDIATLGKKHNLMCVGKSGCGKSWSITQLARIIGVPVSFGDATRLTEMGYVGEDIDDILKGLFSSPKDKLGSVGIVVIDEVDKLVSRGKSEDVTRTGAQQAMLRALDGNQFEIFTTGDKRKSSEKMLIDTRMIPFICLGAFSDMDLCDKKSHQNIGFRRTASDITPQSESHLAQRIIEYGFSEEFINRFDNVHLINSLTVPDMIRILNNPNGGVIRNEVERFKCEGMNLEVKQEAVEAIATKAYAEGMGGARNLYSQLHTILKGVEFEYFGTGKQADVIVYADDVEGIKVRVKEYGNRKKKENGNSAVINQEEIGTAQKSL